MTEQIVTPWVAVSPDSGFDYNRLVVEFGVQTIDNDLLIRFEQVTGHKPHVWLRRGIFFAHRELDRILDHYQAGQPIFLYTGRGPSGNNLKSSLHLGHLIPFAFTKWLQDVFKAIVVIQISDDEKYYFKDNVKFEDVYKLGFENAKDIIACGFDPERTFIFSNYDYSKTEIAQKLLFEMKKKSHTNTIKAIFGLTDNACVGQYESILCQASASYSKFYSMINDNAMCLVAYAVDQDPYFRFARDLAHSHNYYKPCSIISKFLPTLEKTNGKLSSSVQSQQTIYLSSNHQEIIAIVRKSYSGGRQTKEEHQRLGADLTIDRAFHYLTFFLEDDIELEKIRNDYSSGIMMTSQVKQILCDVLIKITSEHQERKLLITDEIINKFYDCTKF